MSENKKSECTLTVPIQVALEDERKPALSARAVAWDSQGQVVYSQPFALNSEGKGEVKIGFATKPGALTIKIGPSDATDEEIKNLDTTPIYLAAKAWRKSKEVRMAVYGILYPEFALIFQRCSTFTINGTVLTSAGYPVPGAIVRAFDVAFFCCWRYFEPLGSAITDINGHFAIKFKWCCRKLPFKKLELQNWCIEPDLVELLNKIMAKIASIKTFIPPIPPHPDFNVLHNMFGEQVINQVMVPQKTVLPKSYSLYSSTEYTLKNQLFDNTILLDMGAKMLQYLPDDGRLKRLGIWPWHNWYDPNDCAPDVLFQVTQSNGISENEILYESYEQTRWDIPNQFNVTLVANAQAVGAVPHQEVPGNCISITHAAYRPVHNIGGNTGCPVTTLTGYHNPGGNSNSSDQPFSEVISIHGELGSECLADYYELQWNTIKNAPDESWQPVPATAIRGFSRTYYGPDISSPTSPSAIYCEPFAIQEKEGKHVLETLHHFEERTNFQDWILRRWLENENVLINWVTPRDFANGTYYLRFKAYQEIAGKLTAQDFLPLFGTAENNTLCITTDNRMVGSGPTDWLGHTCGKDSLHVCTNEPEAAILAVTILDKNGNPQALVQPCSTIEVTAEDKVQIDFIAYDVAGFLANYQLTTLWGESQYQDLHKFGTLAPLSDYPGLGVPVAEAVGPDYAAALTQMSANPKRPYWYGGVLRLIVNAGIAFPVTCSYQLRLHARKRTIDQGHSELEAQINIATTSFAIQRKDTTTVVKVLPIVPANIL